MSFPHNQRCFQLIRRLDHCGQTDEVLSAGSCVSPRVSTPLDTMATKTTAIGSASWISAEKENALEALQTEKDEVVYPAQHQLEWLNEYMGEIFSKSQMYVMH